jgi:hypothetical protein
MILPGHLSAVSGGSLRAAWTARSGLASSKGGNTMPGISTRRQGRAIAIGLALAALLFAAPRHACAQG